MHRAPAIARDDAAIRVTDLETRCLRQTAIAALSQAALRAGDVETILPAAAEMVATHAGAAVVTIGEFTSDGWRVRLRSGGAAPGGPDVHAPGAPFASLVQHSPMIIGDADNRSLLAFLQQITNTTSPHYVAAIIRGGEPPWGFLLAGAPDRAAFTTHEIGFIESVANVVGLLAEQRRRERLVFNEALERFDRIFQNCPVPLGMSTITDGRVIDVNERWLALFGYQREEVLGRTHADLRIIVEPACRQAMVKRAQEGEPVRDVEMKVRTKHGETLEVIVAAVPLAGASGTDVWISALVDITARKRAEAERDQLLLREQIARSEAEQALEKLDAVYTLTDSVLAASDVGELLGELLKRIRKTLQVDHALVLLLEEEGTALYLRAFEGPDPVVSLPEVRVPLGAGASGRIAAEGRPLVVNDYGSVDLTGIKGATEEFVRAKTSSMMGAPFRIGSTVAGVVMATSVQPRQFSAEDLKLLTLAADRVAPAIERGRLIATIRSGLERQRTLSRRLLTAQEEERRRLAIELHDELGQVLTAVKINLESFDRAHPGTQGAATALISSVDDALQRVRDLALDLRPSVLDDLGLPAAMRWYADRFARTAKVEAHLSIGELPLLEPGLRTACFRVAQEALTNVGRHARARHVWIDLHVLAGALELNIRDDGVGFDVAAARQRAIRGGSLGLLGMQERVSLMGGEYEVVNVTAGGTEVRARFPLSDGRQAR